MTEVDYEAQCKSLVETNLKLREEIEELKHDKYKLELRLDVCLYSMVQMQAMLRAWEKKAPKNLSYRASLNDKEKVWLAE